MKLLPPTRPIEYPDSDGKPMAENTLQFDWIVTIKENLEKLFVANDNVFVAGDLLWYPVEGQPEIRLAPDALVVFGRPKGRRGSYQQWVEGNSPPHVVFEVLSPGNRPSEMTRKFKFYEQHGVEEYYIYDPDENELTGWLRKDDELQEVPRMAGWTSPRLGIQFDWTMKQLVIRFPDGKPFLPMSEIFAERDAYARDSQRTSRDLELTTWEKEKAVAERDAAVIEKERALREIAELRAKLQEYEKK